jgi:hypothetical protein
VKVLNGIESALEDAGLNDRLREFRELFHVEYTAISEDFKEINGRVTLLGGAAKESLNAIVDDRLELAGRIVNKYVGDIRGVVLDTVIAGKTINFEKVLEDAGDAPIHHLRTEMNTALMAYGRIVNMEKAEKAGFEKFIYIGPDDDITRPFCGEHLDKIYTADEIAALDNGQGLPVEIYGGGYNCRHQWRPVSDELAAELEEEKEEENPEEE